MAGLLACCALPLGAAVDADLFDGRAAVAVAPANSVLPVTASNVFESISLPDHLTGQRDFSKIGTIAGGQPVSSASVPDTSKVGFSGAELSVSASGVIAGDAVTVMGAQSPAAATAGGTAAAAGGEAAAADVASDLARAEGIAPASVRRDLEDFVVGRVAVGPKVTEQSSKQPVVSTGADGASAAPSSISIPSKHGDYGSEWPAGL